MIGLDRKQSMGIDPKTSSKKHGEPSHGASPGNLWLYPSYESLPNRLNAVSSPLQNIYLTMIENCFRVIPLLLLCFFLGACGGGGPTTLPDAPPPWQEAPSNPDEATAPRPSPFGGNNPRLDNPNKPNSFWSNQPRPSPVTPKPTFASKPNYTINAYANVWVLIQDKRGNELEWISLKSGDEVPIMHRGPLTMTCSSSKSVKISDKNGKKIETGNKTNGINIIRLP